MGPTIVFDAYGTLFDVAGAARLVAEGPGGAALRGCWPALAFDWRRKQLEYTWLRTILHRHADFVAVTADALGWALQEQGLDDPALRDALLDAFGRLPAYPEVASTLRRMRERGLRCAILSNGTPAQLDGMVDAAGLRGMFDAVLSVEELGLYKPDMSVYSMVPARLGVEPGHVLFVSSNGWDIAGASCFGFRTAWVNRAGAPPDRLPHGAGRTGPDQTVADLSQIEVPA